MIYQYRIVRYEAVNEEDMKKQLDNSLALGVHKGKVNVIVAETEEGELSEPQKYSLEEAEVTGIQGCITKNQLQQLKDKEKQFHG